MSEEEALRLVQENEALRRQLQERDERIQLLEQKIDLLIRQIYGAKSEKLDPAQLELLLDPGGAKKEDASAASAAEALLAEAPDNPKNKRSSAKDRPRLPENLPVIEEIVDPPAVVACPQAWRCIGQEQSELLDYEPGRFLRRLITRRKYVKLADKEAAPIIAALPPKLVEGGLVAPGLLAHIVTGKYIDHLPLYRQEQIYKERHEVHLPRQTLARWIEQAAEWLRPIANRIKGEIFENGYIQADETPIRYLAPGNGKTKQGYLWTYRASGAGVYYDWREGRGPQSLLDNLPEAFAGVIQCDGYSVYPSFAAKRDGIELACCMAHIRRKFIEARESAPQQAAWIVRQIAHLYQIEKRLRESRAGPALRQAVRASQSTIILRRLHRALFRLKISRRFLPKSLMGKALDYALEQWPRLAAYQNNGVVELDNNLVENAIRPTALGKKNWLFIGAKEAGWRSAVLYTIIATCRAHGVEPHAYLRAMFETLPSATNHQIPGLTPRAWAAHQKREAKDRPSAA